jgi:hypothetical protein
MFKPILPAAFTLLLCLLDGGKSATIALSAAQSNAPAYTPKDELVVPTNYREWVYLTSGLDMSYASAKEPADMHMFDNVFVNPESYRAFLATGTWPDKTTFVLEVRGAQNPVSINKRGHTQSAEVMGMEIHVKDHGKWSFYDRKNGAAVADLLPPPNTCFSCHEQHAAVDTTFVQFYPTLLPIAEQKKTLSPTYLQEIATPAH